MTWYWASSQRATFCFEVRDGVVTRCAPYARRGLLARPEKHVLAKLDRHGYEVQKLSNS